jgi:integrase
MKSAGREVPMPLELMKLLKEQQYDLFNEDDYIFSATGMPGPNRVPYHYFRNKWKKFATKHSIPDKYKLYGLKHTGNTKMVMTGINSRTLQKLNGHSSLEYIQKNYTGELTVEDIMWVRDHQPKLGEPVKPVINQKDEQTELLKMILEKLSNRI